MNNDGKCTPADALYIYRKYFEEKASDIEYPEGSAFDNERTDEKNSDFDRITE